MQTLIVTVIVLVALVLTARSFYKGLSGKYDGCSCGKGACPFTGPGQCAKGDPKDQNQDLH